MGTSTNPMIPMAALTRARRSGSSTKARMARYPR